MEDEVYYFSSIKQGNLDPKVKFRFSFQTLRTSTRRPNILMNIKSMKLNDHH